MFGVVAVVADGSGERPQVEESVPVACSLEGVAVAIAADDADVGVGGSCLQPMVSSSVLPSVPAPGHGVVMDLVVVVVVGRLVALLVAIVDALAAVERSSGS